MGTSSQPPVPGSAPWLRARWLTPRTAFSSAGLVILAFPDFDFYWLAWVGLAPFLTRLPDFSPREALGWGFLWAAFFYEVTISWLFPVATLGTVLLVVYCAGQTALGFWLIRHFLGWKRGFGWVLAPFVWAGMEFLMAVIPVFSFPWCLLGNSQCQNLPFIQVCSVTGVFGLSFLIVATNSCAAFWLRWCLRQERNGARAAVGFTVLLALVLAAVWAWGARRLQSESTGEAAGETARIALLQGNYDHIYKWSGKSLDDILRTYSRLSARAGERKPDLAIWPETAVPVPVLDVPVALAAVESSVKAAGAYSLVGALKIPESSGLEGDYNTAFLFDPAGRKLPEEYHKRHLVPFGEYVPLKKLLFFVDIVSAGASIFAPGDQATLFRVRLRQGPTLSFGVLICYESAFPQMAREYVQKGANLLVVITNDAWYGRTAMPHQHAGLAALRAVEAGVPLVRAANTGVTCWVDARGRIRGILKDDQGESLFAEGLLIAEPRLEKLDTFYSRWGDVFGVGCLAVTVASGACLAVSRRRKGAGK